MMDEIDCHGCEFYDEEDDRCTAFRATVWIVTDCCHARR